MGRADGLCRVLPFCCRRRDFTNAYLASGFFTMLWHMSSAPGQHTTAVPRFPSHCQPDGSTTPEELAHFRPALFNEANYERDVCAVGDMTFFDQVTPHKGTANESTTDGSYRTTPN